MPEMIILSKRLRQEEQELFLASHLPLPDEERQPAPALGNESSQGGKDLKQHEALEYGSRKQALHATWSHIATRREPKCRAGPFQPSPLQNSTAIASARGDAL